MLSEELHLQEVSEEREGLPCSVRARKVIPNSPNCRACTDGLNFLMSHKAKWHDWETKDTWSEKSVDYH